MPTDDLDFLVGVIENVTDKQELDLKDPIPVITSNIETRELSSESSPYTLSLRQNEFVDDKDFKKFIKSIESQVRNSPEYRLWTSYVRETLGHYSCALTGEVHSQTSVDIHHHPVSLYSIVKSVIQRYQSSEKKFCSFDISTSVIELHYENRIGYVPIVSSLHEKFHSGFLQIPIELVQGDWKYIVYQYDHEEEDLEIIQSRLAITKENCGYSTYHWVKSFGATEESEESN